MERHAERDLEILTAIEEGRPLTQRALAERLGVALGLANLYLKRLAKRGYIKITDFPRKPAAGKRLRYLLTPKGISEKSRLTYEHMAYSLRLYRRARQTLRDALGTLPELGTRRVALYGAGEAAELAYITLRELGIEPVGVFAADGAGDFLGFPVQPLLALRAAAFDHIIVATFDRPEPEIERLIGLGVPVDRLLTLRQPMAPTPTTRTA
ncbi:MAG TPA: winged helix-turn-helix transcriptional regulator [Methylomirabilota bacterium]|nr:winged helix-turn-helix transcriptional regulator [Methylomirabilota bacterium]